MPRYNKALYALKLLVQISETREVLFSCLSPLDIIFLLTVTKDKLSHTERNRYLGFDKYISLTSSSHNRLYKNISDRTKYS